MSNSAEMNGAAGDEIEREMRNPRFIENSASLSQNRISYTKPLSRGRGEHRRKAIANILETMGNTPVVKINRLAPLDVNLFVKIEAFNPLGSVKDRLALGVIEDAERTGKLKPGRTPSSSSPAATPASASPWSARRRATRSSSSCPETFSIARLRQRLARIDAQGGGASAAPGPGRADQHGGVHSARHPASPCAGT